MEGNNGFLARMIHGIVLARVEICSWYAEQQNQYNICIDLKQKKLVASSIVRMILNKHILSKTVYDP